ncbi:hypothetical protein ACFJ8Q_003641 [Escherichia coli]
MAIWLACSNPHFPSFNHFEIHDDIVIETSFRFPDNLFL